MIDSIFLSDKTFTSALDKACINIVNGAPNNKTYKSSELVRLIFVSLVSSTVVYFVLRCISF